MKLLLYCTKNKPYLYLDRGIRYAISNQKLVDSMFTHFRPVNGKIIAECDYKIEKIFYEEVESENFPFMFEIRTNALGEDVLCSKSCLNWVEIDDYLCGKEGYAIHINNLNLFVKPIELKDCIYVKKQNERYCKGLFDMKNEGILFDFVKNAPQNMQKVWYAKECKIEPYILISIHPEWLYKILNREKTVEVRKKVLKEMLGGYNEI